MYGLEKKGTGAFEFDLEKEIRAKPERGKKILEKAEHRIQELKKLLREGASEKEFDQLSLLLHGYTALSRVIKKVTK